MALPLQQSFPDVPPHRLPFGLQPKGVLQRPALSPAVMSQVTGVPPAPYEPVLPQHAASTVQRSWVTLQPPGAWHAMPPPGTLAQSWLQQALLAEQGSPSTVQLVATKSDNGTQMPPLAPVRSHVPLQQSDAAEQISESAWQPMVPLALMQVLAPQVIEQQSLADPQLLPSARHGRSNPSGKISSPLLVFAVSETVAAGCTASTRGARAPVALSSRRRRLPWDASSVMFVAVSSIWRTLGAGACRTADSTAL